MTIIRKILDTYSLYKDNKLYKEEVKRYLEEKNKQRILTSWRNGSYDIEIWEDGTKIRRGDDFDPNYPESIDLKITDYCDAGCAFCHESSTKKGVHANIDFIYDLLLANNACSAELAIGGGNPLAYPQLEMLLTDLTDTEKHKYITNMTVNWKHLTKENTEIINKFRRGYSYYSHRPTERPLLYGLGISIPTSWRVLQDSEIEGKTEITNVIDSRTVLHSIIGIHNPIDLIKHSITYFPTGFFKPTLLILGYKQFGFGNKYVKNFNLELEIDKWASHLELLSKEYRLCFDNLAVEQLQLRQRFSYKEWRKHYMGDDGEYTMYIDAVKQEYASNSTGKRFPCKDLSIKEMFAHVRRNGKS